MSKTIELKVARRVRGFEGRAKAAEENAARLYERVKAAEAAVDHLSKSLLALEKAVAAQSEAQNFLRGALAQFDQAAQGRMDSIMARVCALEPEPIVEPVEPALVENGYTGDGFTHQADEDEAQADADNAAAQ